jgi:hypothetical protein
MVCVDDNTGQPYYNNQGYAGTGTGGNNPKYAKPGGVGPLPQGEYQFTGNWHNSSHTGQNTMNLRPKDPNHNSCTGRSELNWSEQRGWGETGGGC